MQKNLQRNIGAVIVYLLENSRLLPKLLLAWFDELTTSGKKLKPTAHPELVEGLEGFHNKANTIFRYLFLFALINFLNLQGIIYIVTTVYNRPSFIELQYKCFKKFLKEDYEFIIFNDASDLSLRNEIIDICKKLNLKLINVPQEIHDETYKKLKNSVKSGFNGILATFRQGDVIQYAFDTICFNHNDIVLLIDSDVFLINHLNIKEFLQNYDIAGIPIKFDDDFHFKSIVEHPSSQLIFFNMSTLPDKKSICFKASSIKNKLIDCCNLLQFYLKKNNSVKFKKIKEISLHELNLYNNYQLFHQYKFSIKTIDFIRKYSTEFQKNNFNKEFDQISFLNNNFLNYAHGSNWDLRDEEFVKFKSNQVYNFLNS